MRIFLSSIPVVVLSNIQDCRLFMNDTVQVGIASTAAQVDDMIFVILTAVNMQIIRYQTCARWTMVNGVCNSTLVLQAEQRPTKNMSEDLWKEGRAAWTRWIVSTRTIGSRVAPAEAM